MKKMNNKKGFTLAEVLIVVAIIAVLTAIAIPVFTAQLEKSREATDMANIRGAYAEVAAASITDPDNTITASVDLKQTQAKWQTTGANIAGIDITADLWDVAKGKKIEIKYTAGTDGTGEITIGGTKVDSSFITTTP